MKLEIESAKSKWNRNKIIIIIKCANIQRNENKLTLRRAHCLKLHTQTPAPAPTPTLDIGFKEIFTYEFI